MTFGKTSAVRAMSLLCALFSVASCKIGPSGFDLELPSDLRAGYVKVWTTEVVELRAEECRVIHSGVTKTAFGRVQCDVLDGSVPKLNDFEVFGVRVVETARGYDLSIPIGPGSPIASVVRPSSWEFADSRPFRDRDMRPLHPAPTPANAAEKPMPCFTMSIRDGLGRKLRVGDFSAPSFVESESGDAGDVFVALYEGAFQPIATGADRLVITLVVVSK